MNRPALFALLLVLGLSSVATAATTTLERDYTFEASRFHLTNRGGIADLRVDGASPSVNAGAPELPWVGDTFEIPEGYRAASVEIVNVDAVSLASSVRLPSAWIMGPEGRSIRSTPNAALFSRAGFQPDAQAALGPQGFMRGQSLATIRVCPVRWDATTGQLQRVTHVRVRVTLEPTTERAVPRLRVVPDWEDGAVTGPLRPRAEAARANFGGTRAEGSLVATQIPSTLGSPVQYVIITDDAQAAEFQRLADWKTQSGVPAVVRTLSFIRSQYPRGADDQERIRDFIRDAYSRWGTKWVLLGGDTDVIPVRYARNLYYYSAGEDIACDLYYSCVDGNWDGDGDHLYGEGVPMGAPGDFADLFPDVYVGRSPTTTQLEAKAFVDRTLAYAKTPVGDYERNMLIFAEVLFPEDWESGEQVLLDGGTLADELLPLIHNNPSIRTTARLYQNYTDPDLVPGSLPESKAVVLDSLKKGYGFSVHVGHGYRGVMSVGDANLTITDINALTNGSRLTNLYAINCTSNAIDFPCIGESFLKAANGGAVTSVGSTQLDFPYAGRLYEQEFFTVVFDDSITAAGEAQARQKLPQISSSTDDNAYRWMQQSLLLLGDPELRMWTGTPRILTVVHPGTFVLGDTSVTVTVNISGVPLANARVTAYKANDAYRSGLTDGTGLVKLPFKPDSLGPVTVTVTGYDCKPYQGTMTVTSSATAALAEQNPTIDDDNSGGTSGDSDAICDAGEVVDMRVPLRNTGTTSANTVSGTLSTTEPLVTISGNPVSYGSIASGAVATSGTAFRLTISASLPDQREVPFTLTTTDGVGKVRVMQLYVTMRAPELRHFWHVVNDANANGIPEPGETVTYTLKIKNLGTAQARSVTALLRLESGATVSDSTATIGDLQPGEEKTAADGVTFNAANLSAKFSLRLSDNHGLRLAQPMDVTYPNPPTGLTGSGRPTSVKLVWNPSSAADLLGYNIYRGLAQAGPFSRTNLVPTDRISTFEDGQLTPLTKYYYRVTCVDSSGNESLPSSIINVSTNPPSHASFPIPMNTASQAPVAIDHIFSLNFPMDIAGASDVIYAWRPDGSAPVDADGAGATNGDMTTVGTGYAGGCSIGDVNGNGSAEIAGAASDSNQVVIIDQFGNTLPGWPKLIPDRIWSSIALGDLDNDGKRELVFAGIPAVGDMSATAGKRLYVMRSNGTEWVDGDSNPATFGVFKSLGGSFNIGTPALADLDNNGTTDIIYGGFDGKLNAFRPNGTNLPGFPITLPGGAVTSSVAIGGLDGAGDSQLDIAVVTGQYTTFNGPDSLYVFTAAGARRAGFPVFVRSSGANKAPSPALADMNNDGFRDIVVASTDGKVYVYDRNGAIVAPWNGIPFSTMTASATEASPVVADINGDTFNDVVIGDDSGFLTALSGNTGAVLPGFPIPLGAPVTSAAGLCDCDGDGKTEIALTGSDRNLYLWDYDFTFSPSGTPPWPQFHHDARRTGLASNPAFTAVEFEGVASSSAVELSAPAPNPTFARAQMWYSIPSAKSGSRVELAIYDLAGRRIAMLQHGDARPGRFRVTWDLSTDQGQRVEPGLYFARLTAGAEIHSQKLIVIH